MPLPVDGQAEIAAGCQAGDLRLVQEHVDLLRGRARHGHTDLEGVGGQQIAAPHQARDPQRRALMARVDVHADERCTKIFPYQFPAVLRAGLHDGQELVEEVLVNRGGPQRPLSAAELGIKFADNAGRLLPPDVVAQVRDAVLQLADIDNTSSLIEPLSTVDRSSVHTVAKTVEAAGTAWASTSCFCSNKASRSVGPK